MNQIRIYCIFILKEFMTQIFGPNHPNEIVRLIILSDYLDIRISCGYDTTMIIKDKITCFGLHKFGKLKIKSQQKKSFSKSDFREIKCSKSSVLGISYDLSRVYIWNQLDNINEHDKINYAKMFKFANKIESFECGESHFVVLTQNSIFYVWGDNSCGQLGLNNYTNGISPVKHKLSDIKQVFCGLFNTFVINKQNTCYVWGDNQWGQLGLGDDYSEYSPQELGILGIIQISCGIYHTCALTFKRKIWIWGRNGHGQLGLGDTKHRFLPQKLFIPFVVSVTSGSYHTTALTKHGKLFIWGNSFYHQLGLNTDEDVLLPQKLDFTEKIRHISCGEKHNVVVTDDNEIYVWGSNSNGQIGSGSNKLTPSRLKL